MTNMKATKRALVSSVLALFLCFAMLLGTTYAWFTDEVSSANNIIQTGTLDIEMYYGDSADNMTVVDENTPAIFNYKHWEPGYTEVKYVKIVNAGSLAFKFKLDIVPNIQPVAGDPNLAEVIDVYMFDPNTTTTIDRAAIDAATPVGTLADLMAEADGAAHGVLLPDPSKAAADVNQNEAANTPAGEITYCIVLKMQEDAGNEYQNLSVGDGFSLQLMATQYTWENDSFDHLYDESAKFDEAPKANVEKMDDEEMNKPITVTVKTTSGALVKHPVPVVLNTGYVFTAPETAEQAAENPYKLWHADFVVTFDRNVTGDDKIGLAGQYTYFSESWFGAFADQEALNVLAEADVAWVNDNGEIIAGAPLRLLTDFIGVTINYEELCRDVEVFKCGAWTEADLETPLTMTVELRLYEVGEQGDCSNGDGCKHPTADCETGEYITIGTYSYTFGE